MRRAGGRGRCCGVVAGCRRLNTVVAAPGLRTRAVRACQNRLPTPTSSGAAALPMATGRHGQCGIRVRRGIQARFEVDSDAVGERDRCGSAPLRVTGKVAFQKHEAGRARSELPKPTGCSTLRQGDRRWRRGYPSFAYVALMRLGLLLVSAGEARKDKQNPQVFTRFDELSP